MAGRTEEQGRGHGGRPSSSAAAGLYDFDNHVGRTYVPVYCMTLPSDGNRASVVHWGSRHVHARVLWYQVRDRARFGFRFL